MNQASPVPTEKRKSLDRFRLFYEEPYKKPMFYGHNFKKGMEPKEVKR